jgi:rSAM/selenodomain-associated transferase 1
MTSGKPLKQHLIIFTRYPEPGKTKTRLIPALGEVGAANLQQQMTEYTIFQVKELQKITTVSVEVRFTGGDLEKMQNWLGNDLRYQLQGEGDLGTRMKRSLINAFSQGAEKIIIIGTAAFEQLNVFNLVLGPALDGGYYLIGLQQPIAKLFANIPWGTAQVFSKTVEIAQKLNLSIGYLQPLADIDCPKDLENRDFSNIGQNLCTFK